jgi:hypothetical protein
VLQVEAKNKREAAEVDRIFLLKQQREKETAEMETQIAGLQRQAEEKINNLEPRKLQLYKDLVTRANNLQVPTHIAQQLAHKRPQDMHAWLSVRPRRHPGVSRLTWPPYCNPPPVPCSQYSTLQAEAQAQQGAIDAAAAQIRQLLDAQAGPSFNDQYSALEKRITKLQRCGRRSSGLHAPTRPLGASLGRRGSA